MKKYTYLLIAGGLMFSASSCKKSYTCECTHPFSAEKIHEEVKAGSKKRAEKKCDAKNQTGPATDGAYDCHLIN